MKKIKPAPVLKRVRFTFEALCLVDENVESMDLATVVLECNAGDLRGGLLGSPEVKLLNLKQAHVACERYGVDLAELVDVPEFENGTTVFWTDPDNNEGDGWYTITGYRGDGEYTLVNGVGTELTAPGHELTRPTPKLKPKLKQGPQ